MPTHKQTHEPSSSPSTMAGTTKDTDRGVASDSQGFQGAKPNAQAAEKDLSLTSINGEPSDKEKDEGGSNTGGTTNPTYGSGPTRNKARDIINENNTRWWARQASDKEIADWIANN